MAPRRAQHAAWTPISCGSHCARAQSPVVGWPSDRTRDRSLRCAWTSAPRHARCAYAQFVAEGVQMTMAHAVRASLVRWKVWVVVLTKSILASNSVCFAKVLFDISVSGCRFGLGQRAARVLGWVDPSRDGACQYPCALGSTLRIFAREGSHDDASFSRPQHFFISPEPALLSGHLVAVRRVGLRAVASAGGGRGKRPRPGRTRNHRKSRGSRPKLPAAGRHASRSESDQRRPIRIGALPPPARAVPACPAGTCPAN